MGIINCLFLAPIGSDCLLSVITEKAYDVDMTSDKTPMGKRNYFNTVKCQQTETEGGDAYRELACDGGTKRLST
jgi:hypothetical protein